MNYRPVLPFHLHRGVVSVLLLSVLCCAGAVAAQQSGAAVQLSGGLSVRSTHELRGVTVYDGAVAAPALTLAIPYGKRHSFALAGETWVPLQGERDGDTPYGQRLSLFARGKGGSAIYTAGLTNYSFGEVSKRRIGDTSELFAHLVLDAMLEPGFFFSQDLDHTHGRDYEITLAQPFQLFQAGDLQFRVLSRFGYCGKPHGRYEGRGITRTAIGGEVRVPLGEVMVSAELSWLEAHDAAVDSGPRALVSVIYPSSKDALPYPYP